MELDAMLFWNIILTMVIAPAFWAFRQMFTEVKRLQILLNKTREDYATKNELRDDMARVMEALHRLEDKLDKALDRK
jgi:membrane protein insertase Oxa1/YidC/SpoIIIJ